VKLECAAATPVETHADAAFIAVARAALPLLLARIAHGDEEHRAWLKGAIEEHFALGAVP